MFKICKGFKDLKGVKHFERRYKVLKIFKDALKTFKGCEDSKKLDTSKGFTDSRRFERLSKVLKDYKRFVKTLKGFKDFKRFKDLKRF